MTAPSPVDGGAAFPSGDVRDADGIGISEGSRGMSLRDWFAGQALAGVLASEIMVRSIGQGARDIGSDSAYPFFADAAYEIADAMLAKRAK